MLKNNKGENAQKEIIMKYVDFFGHKVSKLILGDNPFNGHSYIANFINGQEMVEYATENRILDAMHQMEELGVNTMLPLADPYIIRILRHYRANGGKMNFIFQQYQPMNIEVSLRHIMEVDPIGIYVSGSYSDVRFETGRVNEIHDMLKTMRTAGIKVGLGTHHPEMIETSEREGWDADFYMACMYNFRRRREGEESGFLTGKSKAGIVVEPSDRPLMLKALQGVKKPVIAFKLFAGGQMLVQKAPEERRELITDAYDTVFGALKPNDFGVIGVFQKYHDQIKEDIEIFDEWAERRGI